MRVLMLSPDLAADGAGRAGYVGRLASGLAGDGHDVTVISRAAGPAPTDGRLGGARAIGVAEAPPMIDGRDRVAAALHFNSAALAAATSLLLDGPVDVIHAHDWPMTWTAVALKRIWDVPIVAALHGLASATGAHGTAEAAAERWLAREAAAVVVRSDRRRRAAREWLSLPAGRIEVVPDGQTLARRTTKVYERAR